MKTISTFSNAALLSLLVLSMLSPSFVLGEQQASKWFVLADRFIGLRPKEEPHRIPEGDYYINFAGDYTSKHTDFGLSFFRDDDLWFRDDRRNIWRLYYPRFSEPHFILQNMHLGHDGDGHPQYQWYAQVDGRHLELEPSVPTLWVAYPDYSHKPNTYFIRMLNDASKWIGKAKSGRVLMTHFQHDRNSFRFTKLE